MFDFNLLEQSQHETLITRAQDAALNRLAEHHGFTRPLFIPIEDFREALISVVYSSKPSFCTLLNFIFKLFNKWSSFSSYEMTAASSSSLTMDTMGNSRLNLNNRLCLINGEVHYLSYSEVGDTFHFSPVRTAYFQGAAFNTGDSYTVNVAPFSVIDYGCVVYIRFDEGLFAVPKAYLQTSQVTPPDIDPPQLDEEPIHGFYGDYYSTVEGERDVARPVYLTADYYKNTFFKLFNKLVSAGILVEVENYSWSDEVSSLYAPISSTGSVDPNQDFTIEVDRS